MQSEAKEVAGRSGGHTRARKAPKQKDRAYHPSRQARTHPKNSPHRTRSRTATEAAEAAEAEVSGSSKGEESEESECWEEAEGVAEVTVVGGNSRGVEWEQGVGASDPSDFNNPLPSESEMTEASGTGSGTGDMSQLLMAMLQQQNQQREEDNRRIGGREVEVYEGGGRK